MEDALALEHTPGPWALPGAAPQQLFLPWCGASEPWLSPRDPFPLELQVGLSGCGCGLHPLSPLGLLLAFRSPATEWFRRGRAAAKRRWFDDAADAGGDADGASWTWGATSSLSSSSSSSEQPLDSWLPHRAWGWLFAITCLSSPQVPLKVSITICDL